MPQRRDRGTVITGVGIVTAATPLRVGTAAVELTASPVDAYVQLVTDTVTNVGASGAFAGGAAACGAGTFAVPRNGFENELLKTAKARAGVDRVWLAYSDSGDSTNWTAS